jgi:hypothetical protein
VANYGSKTAQQLLYKRLGFANAGRGVKSDEDEVRLLNGLLALGIDPTKVASFSDRNPNRRFLGDAITRALRAGVSQDDIVRAISFDEVARTEHDPVKRVQGLAQALGLDMNAITQKAKAKGNTPDAWINATEEVRHASQMTGRASGTISSMSDTTFRQYATSQQATYIGKGDVRAGAGGPAPGIPAPLPGDIRTPPPPGGTPGLTPAPPGSAATKGGAAGRVGGAGGLLGDTSTLPRPMNPEEAEALIRQRYGYMGSLLDIPDIHRILYGVADGSIAPDEFDHQLMATDWAKTRNDAQQAWEILKATKPTEAQTQLTASADQIKGFAVGLGFTLDDATAKEIATSAISMGWDPTQTRSAVASHYQFVTGQSATAGIAQQLKAKAADYLLPMSDQALTQWGQQLISGTASMDNFTDYARTQAKAQYPGLGAWLDQDPTRTVKQFTDPYAQQAAQILEIPPDQVDFTNPKYQALFGKLDPKTGERSIMTGPEWSAYLKQQPDWQYTKNAHDTVSNLTATLAKTFGQVG